YFLCSRVSCCVFFFFFSSRRRHTRFSRDWSSDVCSSDLLSGRGRIALQLLDAAGQRFRPLAPGRLGQALPVEQEAQEITPLHRRSEERRVGKEWTSRREPNPDDEKEEELVDRAECAQCWR